MQNYRERERESPSFLKEKDTPPSPSYLNEEGQTTKKEKKWDKMRRWNGHSSNFFLGSTTSSQFKTFSIY